MKYPRRGDLERMRELLKGATVLPDPSSATVTRVLQHLAMLGLQDEPDWVGISSSVMQYALSAAVRIDHPAAPAPDTFITTHPGLLEHAALLTDRFHLRPITPETLITTLAQKDHP